MNGHGCVSIKPYLQEQVIGRCDPQAGLWTLGLTILVDLILTSFRSFCLFCSFSDNTDICIINFPCSRLTRHRSYYTMWMVLQHTSCSLLYETRITVTATMIIKINEIMREKCLPLSRCQKTQTPQRSMLLKQAIDLSAT